MKAHEKAVALMAVTIMVICTVAVAVPSNGAQTINATQDLAQCIADLGNTETNNETTIVLDDQIEYYLDHDKNTKDATGSNPENVGFYGKTLIIDGDADGDGVKAKVTVHGYQEINGNNNSEKSIVIRNVQFVTEKQDADRCVFGLNHYMNVTFENCISDGVAIMICCENTPGSALTAKDCNLTVSDPAKDSPGYYALTLKGTTLTAQNIIVNGYTRGINLEMDTGTNLKTSAIADNCDVTGIASDKKALQFAMGNEGYTAIAKNCTFTNCGSAISLNETLVDGNVISINNIFTNCSTDFLYSATENAMSQAKIISSNDTFDGDGTVSAEAGRTPPADSVTELGWYSPGTEMTLSDTDDLLQFSNLVNSGITFEGETVSLIEGTTYDISGSEWTPIGITVGNSDRPFKGTFEGNGAVISGLTMTSTGLPYYNGMDSGDYYAYGFFGGVVGGTVKNITFTNYTISKPGQNSQNNVTAVAVGTVLFSGEVSGIIVGEGTVDAVSRAAGVVGYIGGAKTGTDGPANIDGTAQMGTITISDNENNADIKSNWTTTSHGTAAGIISTTNIKSMSGGTYSISNNTNNGDIFGYFSAGIVASDFSNDTVSIITGNTNNGNISNSVNVSGTVALGICAVKNSNTSNVATTVTGNTNTGSVTSSAGTASGIVGTIYKGADISGNTNEGSVTGYVYASGIVTNVFGGEISANTNTGTIEITCKEETVTLGDNDYETSVGQIVANLNGGTLDASECVTGGTVKAPSGITYSGDVVGRIAYGDATGMDDSGDIGAVRMVGNGNFDVTLTDVNVTDLTLVAGHNDQGSEGTPHHFVYTLALEDSSIGTMKVVGECHTGINLTISGGSIKTVTSDITNNSGGETSFKLLLSGAEVGTVDVTEGESPLKIATNNGGSVDEVRNDLRVTIGIDDYNTTGNNPNENVANSGTIGYVVSETDIVENSQVSENQTLPEYRVYAGTDTDKFASETGDLGIMNAVSVECYENAQLPENLREDISLFIPKNTTFTLGSEFKGEIVGYDETSRLSIAEGGSYDGLTSGEYAFTDNTDNPWGAPEVFTVDGIGYVTLQAAVDAASDGDTIYLNKDTETTPVTIDKSVSLDLGKHTLKIIEPTSGSSDRWGITFTSDDCAITNGTILDERSKTSATKVAVYVLGSNGHASLSTSDVTMSTYPCKEDSYSYVLRVEGDASATLNSGTIINESQNESGVGKVVGVTVFGNNVKADTYNTTADLIVNSDVTIETSGYAVSGNGSNQNGTNITINGGTLKSTKSLGIYHPQDGVLTINDGSISGITGVEIRSGTLIMNGGSVEGTASGFVAVENGNGPTSEGAGIAVVQHTTEMSIDVSVKNGDVSGIKALYEANVQKNEEPVDIEISLTGGNFIAKPGEGSTAVDVTDVKEFISGGTFNTDVSDYCVPGLKTDENANGDFVIGVDKTVVDIPVNYIMGFVFGGQTQTYDVGATITTDVTWTSTVESIATVQNGVITFLSEGYTLIVITLADSDIEVGFIGVDVVAVPYVEGVDFEPITDTTFEEMGAVIDANPDMIPEDWRVDTVGMLSLESEYDTFTIPYSAFIMWDWEVTSENYTDYEFLVIHFPESGGYDLPTVTASSEGLTVTTGGYSPFIFLYRLADDSGTGPIIPPWGWDDDDEYIPPITPVQPEASSGDDDTTTIVACAAAAVVAALMAAFLIIERRRN